MAGPREGRIYVANFLKVELSWFLRVLVWYPILAFAFDSGRCRVDAIDFGYSIPVRNCIVFRITWKNIRFLR